MTAQTPQDLPRDDAGRIKAGVRAVLGLLALAAFLCTAIPATWENVQLLRQEAETGRRLDAVAARSAAFGPLYVARLEEIRRTIPHDEPYFLVDGEEGPVFGASIWVRYQLAPRQAIDLGRLADLRRRGPRLPKRARLRWVVIAYRTGTPAKLLTRQEFLALLGEVAR